MRIVKIHKFFITLFAALALAITPSISFATAPQEVENCLNTANSIQDPDQRDAALSACFQFSMTYKNNSGMATITFKIGAVGTFYIDCGYATRNLAGDTSSSVSRECFRDEQDNCVGSIWKVVQSTPNSMVHTCVYVSPNPTEVTIRIAGEATGYSATSTNPAFAIHYQNSSVRQSLVGINGSLGAIFPTLTTGTRKQPSFYQSFKDCTSLEGEFPSTLFSGISGAPEASMFRETFAGCEALSGPLPATLFSGISGEPAEYMFAGTFDGCKKMVVEEIPSGFFGNISGDAATGMFNATFRDCANIYGSIPDQLFGTISGNATDMFKETFNECINLGNQYGGPESAYYIPKSLFLSFNGTNISSNMSNIFNNTKLMTSCPSGTRQWEPYPNFTAAWSSKVACEPIPEFTVTTSETNLFKFALSAAGVFNVDCGTGGTLTGDSTVSGSTITRNSANTEGADYQCEYADNASPRTIKFTSTSVTGYGAYSAIRFGDSSSSVLTPGVVTGIEGSLGAVFPTVGASVPRFSNTFRNCSNLQGNTDDVLSGLFDGVTGALVQSQFFRTFYGCSGLTGEIPPGLFSGISGQLVTSAFKETFRGCSGITGSVPVELFENITPTGNDMMIWTGFQDIFYGTGLDTCCHEGGAVPISNNNWTRFTGDLLINNTSYYPWRVNDDNELAVACQTNSTDRQCAVPCDFAQNLRVGAYSFALKKRDSNPITAEKTLNVKEPGAGETETCYVPFSSTEPASINNNGIQGILAIKVNGTTYYAEPSN